jgi:hypothetical protein
MKDFWKLVDVQLEMIRKKNEKAAKKYIAGSHLNPFAHTSTRQFAFLLNEDIKKHRLQYEDELSSNDLVAEMQDDVDQCVTDVHV